MKKGTMANVKIILGAIIGIAGLGLLFFQETMTNLLCGNKEVFALFLIIAGFFLAKPKRWMK